MPRYSLLRRTVKALPPIRRLVEQRDALRAELERLREPVPVERSESQELRFPIGHYYSPIPRMEEVRAREAEIFAVVESLPALDMRPSAQLDLVAKLARFYTEQPFSETPSEGLRYHFANGWFQHADGLILYGLLRHLRPQRVIEIGSGFSSALMIDTNELFLDGRARFTFIDPHPERLLGVLHERDRGRLEIVSKPAQQVDVELFGELGPGDILFVDSSHVCRVGSDVNKIFFEILPRLKVGVIIHLHDIFHPFEYPKDWVYMGRFFTEAYLARAFLMYNHAFQVVLSNSFLHKFHLEQVKSSMPLWGTREGASLWLERVS